MNDTLSTIFGLLGGLAVFIFGMNLMSESLQKVAGDKMKSVLQVLTRNRVMGVLAGALVTAYVRKIENYCTVHCFSEKSGIVKGGCTAFFIIMMLGSKGILSEYFAFYREKVANICGFMYIVFWLNKKTFWMRHHFNDV